MYIYLIERTDEVCYDEYGAHVIVANNRSEVINLAKGVCSDEGKEIWEKATITMEGKYICSAPEPFILLSSYKGS